MMGPEEIGEKKSINHTPTIALTVAAVLLLIVGALSYRDYVRNSLEKEYAEKERMMMARHGYAVQPYQAEAAQQQGNVALQNNYQLVQPGAAQPGAAQVTGQQNQVAPLNQNLNNVQLAQQAANMGVESSLPQASDPDITAIQNSLDQVRQQSQRTEQQYNELMSGVDERVNRAVAASNEPVTSELPEFLREAVANPPGGNPSVQAEMEQMKKKVKAAPSLARVTGYDKDWGIVTFNAGAGQGVAKDQRFAVRRGDTILGWIKVDEVQANSAIAVLVTKNRNIDTAEKPAVGDDLIDFEMF